MERGLLIVLEGIEGCGKGTQTRMLKEFLEKAGKTVVTQKYPDYGHPIGNLLHDFLHNKIELSTETQFLLYATDFIKDKELIEKSLSEGKIVLLDRYLYSTLCYQVCKGFSREKGLNFVEGWNLAKPDVAILVDISVDTSIDRKKKEKGYLDRHEGDSKLLEGVRDGFLYLAQNDVFAEKWFIVNGECGVDEVHQKITEIVSNRLSSKNSEAESKHMAYAKT